MEGTDYDHFAFHDVDTICGSGPVVQYAYPRGAVPLHLTPPGLHPRDNYPEFLGGNIIFTREQFQKVNGFHVRGCATTDGVTDAVTVIVSKSTDAEEGLCCFSIHSGAGVKKTITWSDGCSCTACGLQNALRSLQNYHKYVPAEVHEMSMLWMSISKVLSAMLSGTACAGALLGAPGACP